MDEPDSHLHPNNQRLICALLRRITEERDTQVIMTTHSRHVVDAVGRSANFLWVQNGVIEPASEDDELPILMDLGALDVKERVSSQRYRLILLTEDDILGPLEAIAGASGLDLTSALILPYSGVTGIRQLTPLVRMIRSVNPESSIAIHRDRDMLTDSDVSGWNRSVRALGVEPFVTSGMDLEAYFINSQHLASLNPGYTAEYFSELISRTVTENMEALTANYFNKVVENERKHGRYGRLDPGKLAAGAAATVSSNPSQAVYGKAFLRMLRSAFQRESSENLVAVRSSPIISDQALADIGRRGASRTGRRESSVGP